MDLLLKWSFQFLTSKELVKLLRVSWTRGDLFQELWYHAALALCRPYPFIDFRRHEGGWEVTYWYYKRYMSFRSELHGSAVAELWDGLANTRFPGRFPTVAVAARQFLRLYPDGMAQTSIPAARFPVLATLRIEAECFHGVTGPDEAVKWDQRLLSAAGCAILVDEHVTWRGSEDVSRALKRGADPNATLGLSPPFLARAAELDKPPVYFALQRGDLAMVQQLLNAGAHTDHLDRSGTTLQEYGRQRLVAHPQCLTAAFAVSL